jgi:NAD(P)-dependent dehydrogenase (short-subunit alcohol dehydrogenase family)
MDMKKNKTFLVFGGSGSIGSKCCTILLGHGEVVSISSDLGEVEQKLSAVDEFAGIIWAQGMNVSDSMYNFDLITYEKVFEANVTFILKTLSILTQKNKIAKGAQLLFISSIWSSLNKPNKLSYSISKAAVNGLVRDLAIEFGPNGVCVNSLSPGPVDSNMTRNNLSETELSRIISETPIKRLLSIDEIAKAASTIVTGGLFGVTGQDLVIDGGWSVTKLV